MIKFSKLVLITVIVFNLLSYNFAYAAIDYLPIVQCGRTAADAPAAQRNACTTCDFFKMVKNTIDFMLYWVTPALATFFFIYAGFLMLISGANPGFFSQAKNIFTNTIYAVIIILIAWLITNTFIQSFGPANVAGNWWQFSCPAGLP